MTQETIQKLNQINIDFYKEIAPSFDNSRQYSWQGWEILWEEIKEKKIKTVLDIGCGNGRFLKFLESKGWQGKYLGIDNSKELLEYAKQEEYLSKPDFITHDIVSDLENLELKKKYDLIVCFGVMHHIPSYENRLKLMNFIGSTLTAEGFASIAFWKFIEEEKYQKRLGDWSKKDINEEDLEGNDYLLDWQRGSSSQRYCHYVDDSERDRLIVDSKLETLKVYRADGKSEKLNEYLLCYNTELKS